MSGKLKRQPEILSAYWVISGSDEFGNNKQELKKVRTQLNKDSGIDEADKEINSNDWKFKISKAPGHPRYNS